MADRVIQGYFVTRQPNGQTLLVQTKPTAARPASARTTFAAGVPVAQPKGGDDSLQIDPVRLGLASGGGRPLPDAVRSKMEAALGADFSGVRVHIGPQAERIGALAFTIGTDIYFAPGRYQPDSVQGQQLLGHELAHVVQQRQGRVRGPNGGGVAVVQDHALEAEADRMAQRAATVQAKPAGYHPAAVASQPKPVAPPVYSPYGATSQPAQTYRLQPMTSQPKLALSRTYRPQGSGPIQRYRDFQAARGTAQYDYKIVKAVDPTFGRYHIKFHNIRGLGFFDEIHVVFEELNGNNYFFYTDQGVPIVAKSSGLDRRNQALTLLAQGIVDAQLLTSATIAGSVAQQALNELDRVEAERRVIGERLLKEKAEKEALDRPAMIRAEVERLASTYALARQLRPSGILERLVERGVMYKLFEMDFVKLRSTPIGSWPVKYQSLIKPGLNPTLEFDEEDDQYDVFYDFDEVG